MTHGHRPVQLLVVAFDEPHFTGAIVEELNRLRANDLIRLLDVLVVTKDLDGSVTAAQVSDLSIGEAEKIGALIGALIGVGFDGEDGMEAGALIGAEEGADGHLIPDSEMYDIRRTPSRPGAPQPWRLSSTCGRAHSVTRSPARAGRLSATPGSTLSTSSKSG